MLEITNERFQLLSCTMLLGGPSVQKGNDVLKLVARKAGLKGESIQLDTKHR